MTKKLTKVSLFQNSKRRMDHTQIDGILKPERKGQLVGVKTLNFRKVGSVMLNIFYIIGYIILKQIKSIE